VARQIQRQHVPAVVGEVWFAAPRRCGHSRRE
jgi:hypothetical protein